MLVLTRRIGEMVRIGEQIEVVVLGINGNSVRIGFKAPANVTILREEIVPERLDTNDSTPLETR